MEEALSLPFSSSKTYQHNGKKVSLKEFCDENGLDYITVRNRLKQSKMSFEDAIDMSKGKFHKRYELDGKIVNIKEECRQRGLSYHAVMVHLNNGKSIREVLILDPQKKKDVLELRKICKDKGVNYPTVVARVRRGMSLEEALNYKLRGMQ